MVQKQKKLGELLRDAGLITERQINVALERQKKWGGRFGYNLVQSGAITEKELMRFIAGQTNVGEVDLSKVQVDQSVISLVPHKLAEQFNLIPIKKKDQHTLIVACADPTDLNALDQVRFVTGMRIIPTLCSMSEVVAAINRYYLGWSSEDDTQPNFENTSLLEQEAGVVRQDDMEKHGGKAAASDPDLILFGDQGLSEGETPTASSVSVDDYAEDIERFYQDADTGPVDLGPVGEDDGFRLDFEPLDNSIPSVLRKYVDSDDEQLAAVAQAPKSQTPIKEKPASTPKPRATARGNSEFSTEQKLKALYSCLLRKGLVSEEEINQELMRLWSLGKL